MEAAAKAVAPKVAEIDHRVNDELVPRSLALNEPFQEAHRHAQAQQVAYADESGWREGRGKAWLWVMATGLVTVFMICRGEIMLSTG